MVQGEMDRCSDAVVEVTTQIMRYLADHPDASVGLPGIRDFWLGGFPQPGSSKVLDDALDRLVAAQVLNRVALPGGGSIYRLVRGS
jgi:hypothetical protein